MTPIPSLYLGIDTGGTYTDGILLDPLSRQVVQSTKVLTTLHDLRLCIAEVLDRLVPADPACIALVSLSTTLATNAIAEGKRKPVALLLFGYDPELVHTFKFQKQFGTHDYFFVEGKHDSRGVQETPLDEGEIVRIAREMKGKVDALAVSAYAGPMNASHEERAAALLSEGAGLPVVQAHHLSSELDSIQRATTASLNASLLSNAQDFLSAVIEMVAERGIRCPISMVKGDGSLVNVETARTHPVEIIHSGPATSAVGGHFLAGVETALVIDMGGTTTDIALVEGGKVQILEQAATVGPYRTCVRTVKVRSFGLGGDSRINFDRWGGLTIGPERTLPLSYLCHLYPHMKAELIEWMHQKKEIHYPDQIECWLLRNEPARPFTDARTCKAIDILRGGPVLLPKLLKGAGARSLVNIDAEDLIRQEIVSRAALTPTDLLHLTGEFAPWDAEIAQAATANVARIWDEKVEDFIRRVKGWMTRRIAAEVIEFLSGQQLSKPSYHTAGNALDRWLYEETLNPGDPYLGCRIFLKAPIVGIGAPARAFLPAVAEALGTEILLPPHYEVANAVGTVVGNVLARQEGEVFPCVEGISITGFYGRVDSWQQQFVHYEQALEYVRNTLLRRVSEAAQAAGAAEVTVEIQEQAALDGMAHLTAWGMGRPGLNH